MFEVGCLVEHLISFWVKIANLADILLALRVGHGSICDRHLTVVFNDLDGLQIALELEKIGHDT